MRTMCHVMGARPSAYYAWVKRPRRLISAGMLHLHRRAKALFNDSRQSLGRQELMKKPHEVGFEFGRTQSALSYPNDRFNCNATRGLQGNKKVTAFC